MELNYNKIKNILKLDKGLIPVAIQNYKNKEFIMVGFTNLQALEKTISTKLVTLWSRSRNKLWVKGELSGNYFKLIKLYINCNNDCLLYLVELIGDGACHEKDKDGKYYSSCFHN